MVQARIRRRASLRHAAQIASRPASSRSQAFFANLERELDAIEYFRPLDKRATMLVNLRNIFARMQPTQQDIQTLHGIVMALSEGRKGPARGGVLDGEEANTLRALLAEYGEEARARRARSGARALAAPAPQSHRRRAHSRGTRSPRTAALPERASSARCRSGAHITDFVSFPLRVVIDLVPAGESERAAKARSERAPVAAGARLSRARRGGSEVEADLPAVLDRLAQEIARVVG